MEHSKNLGSYLCFLAALIFVSNTMAAMGKIDCPSRSDFQACYLTTEDPYEQNFATLLRGLEVKIIGRSSNGRWKVRIIQVQNCLVVPHDNWPNGGPAEGWVNPDFLVTDANTQQFGSNGPQGAHQTSANNGIGLLGMNTANTGLPPVDQGSVDTGATTGSFSPAGMQSTGTMTGSQFLQQTAGMSGSARESAILAAVRAGHVPSFLSSFVAVSLQWQGHSATVHVSPDYVSIGTDDDYVRMPMSAPTAQAVADLYNCTLPRPKLVDAIWQNAHIKLAPRPLPPTSQMTSNEWYRRSNEAINEQLANQPLGRLIAGHKKDVVLTERLLTNRNKVAIYGWHRTNGNPIQSLTTVHGKDYADYSHGVRLIANTMVVDGQSMSVNDVLQNPSLCGLLTRESNIRVLRYP